MNNNYLVHIIHTIILKFSKKFSNRKTRRLEIQFEENSEKQNTNFKISNFLKTQNILVHNYNFIYIINIFEHNILWYRYTINIYIYNTGKERKTQKRTLAT